MTGKEKKKWIEDNKSKFQSLGATMIPFSPIHGQYINVNGVDIPKDVFPDEFNTICYAYFAAITKIR